MKRAIFAALAILLPLAASAQDTAAPPATPESDSAIRLAAAPASQPAGPRKATKRRGSMVGYIEDPTITSQVRVRFDAARGMNSPDRAEFFYGKCGCYRDLPSSHPLFDANAPGPGPGIVSEINFQELYVLGEYAVTPRVSVFAELPFRWLRPQSFVAGTGSFGNQAGVADVRAGAKFSVFADEMHDVTVMLRASLPSGDARKGLGTDHSSIEPALLVRTGVTDRFSIESQLGASLPTGGSKGIGSTDEKFSGKVLYYGIGPSYDLVTTDRVRFTPVIELVGWRVLGGFQTNGFAPADGTNILNIKLGARTTVKNGSFYAGFGLGFTDAVWYDKMFRLEYRARF